MVEADLQRVATGSRCTDNEDSSGHRRCWVYRPICRQCPGAKRLPCLGVGLGPSAAVDCVECDLTDKPAISRAVSEIMPDVVVHLAAMAFVGDGHPEDFYRVNVFGALNLLEALSQNKQTPSRVLVASSANVYGNVPDEELTEEICPAPINHYAASKLAMEHMVRTYFDRLPIVITRALLIIRGPGRMRRFVIPEDCRALQTPRRQP